MVSMLSVRRALLDMLSLLTMRKKRETRIITFEELVEILKGPDLIVVPSLMYQLKQTPPELREFLEQER